MYRTFVVWSDWRVIVFPGILYLASAGAFSSPSHMLSL